MPHFILDCSDDLFRVHDKRQVMEVVFKAAEASGLFSVADIKVRIRPFTDFITGGDGDAFLHVFSYIMEGRTQQQKNDLSKSIVSALTKLFPDVAVVSMNVMEFERVTYNNRSTV